MASLVFFMFSRSKRVINLAAKSLTLFCILNLSGCASVLPPHLSSHQLQKMEGNWRSDGYGFLLKVKRGHAWIYDINRHGCIEDTMSTHEFAYGFPSIVWRDNHAFGLGQESDGKHIEFNRIADLPDSCGQKQPNNPLAVFDSFATTMAEHYAFFELHNINWSQRVQQARSRLDQGSSDQQLFDTLKGLLGGISDSHLGFRARLGNKTRTYTRRTLRDLEPALRPLYQRLSEKQQAKQSFSKFRQSWVQQQRQRTASQLFGKRLKSASDGKLYWGRDADRGYLAINQFVGFSTADSVAAELKAVDKHLEKILRELSGVKYLVVDVSLARGGYSGVAKTIARQLAGLTQAGVDYHYLSRYAADSTTQTQQKVFMRSMSSQNVVNDNSQRQHTLSITVITSDVTTSAAEEFVLALRALPNVTQVGTPTNGSLSDILAKALPNGWVMILSNEVLIDPAGISYEGAGIPPVQTINLFDSDNPSATHANAVEAIFRR